MSPEANRAPADRVVSLNRIFPVSRELLFRAWTDPVELGKWWGPRGWTAHRCALDVRPEGSWKTWFRLPDGSERLIGGTYVEVSPPVRLVFTWEPAPDGIDPEEPSIVTLEFHDHAGGTELALTHRKLTTGRAVDMDVGWTNTFDSLGDYVQTLDPAITEGDSR